jgi:aspartyl-tRNA(Asn)/glutamyl-tRNA(Gln) amidotransferase subunit B
VNWQPVIGIEVHVELGTASKMFCGCAVSFGEEPNRFVCPTCLGLPGAMPVPNETALEWITRIGLALNCQVASSSVFHRKNYFYADVPKNYQITQYDLPICREGYLDVSLDGETSRVGIERAHMEEDTGKSLHQSTGGRIHAASATLLDFNRSGVPLVEIVSKPDLRSAAQARAYAQELRAVVAELGVSDARMEEGSIRFDANVSVRPEDSEMLGTKVEVKNMNSFRSLERAVTFEISRQITELERGGSVIQETRHWDEDAGVTRGMRTKEESSDYRYFAEPDLTPLEFRPEYISKIAATVGELPAGRRARFAQFGLEPRMVSTLAAADVALRSLFDETLALGADPAPLANWITGEVTAALRREGVQLDQVALRPVHLSELLNLVDEKKLSASAAKEVLAGVMAGEGGPLEVAEARDLIQISDTSVLQAVIDEVLAANPDALDRYRAGESKVLGFLVGQVMRASGGKAEPKQVNDLLRQRLR